MMKNFYLVILIAVFSLASYSQPNDRNDSMAYRLEAGYQNFRTLDHNTSPLQFVANNGVFSFQFEKSNPGGTWNLGISFSVGSNQSKRFGVREGLVLDPYLIDGSRDTFVYIINPGLSFIQPTLYSSYYKTLNTNKTMLVGASINNKFYYGGMGADTWFFNQLSILPAYRVTLFESSLHSLIGEVSFPILSFLVRQPYSRRPSLPERSSILAHLQTGSSFATINSFQQINVQLGYRYLFSSGNLLGFTYYFTWMRYSNIPDRNLGTYSNSIVISYTL
jgi:hypothetical protein